MSHGDTITGRPPASKVLAHDARLPVAAMIVERGLYGCQFHPEWSTRPRAWRSSRTFSTRAATASRPGPMSSVIEDSVATSRPGGQREDNLRASRRRRLGRGRGAVHKALGDQLTCVFVDTGCCA